MYNLYVRDRFQVNRRYQRKLVWTVEEKAHLVDSIDKDLPLPLFLVAELGGPGDLRYELIDGMQRLNAIFSFIENELPLQGEYFDLEALADTKNQKDKGLLTQKQPIMNRERAVRFVNYQVALSVFRSTSSASVDEVFRRLNSGGRRLSRQELRQAGTTSELANLVRVISSRIRGDTSPGDIVPLKTMPMLSINNRDLQYGVHVDSIFWVKEGILRSGDVRESQDEQLILDILIDMLIDPIPNSGTQTRDSYYDYEHNSNEGEGDDNESPSPPGAKAIGNAINERGRETIATAFLSVHDEIREALQLGSKKFTNVLGVGSGGRYPRYYHGVFLAIYELMHRDHLRVKDRERLLKLITDIAKGKKKKLSIPSGGGDWQKDVKRETVDAVKGVLRTAFEPRSDGSDDLGRHGYASDLETILNNALVEQQLFDCKQGLLLLHDKREFDESSLIKICRSLTAMANMGPGCVGYIAIGIADDEKDAKRIEVLDRVSPTMYRRFFIVGLEREAAIRKSKLNDYWPWLLQRVSGLLAPELAAGVNSESRLVNYHGRSVGLIKVRAQRQPHLFKESMVERSGSSTIDVPRNEEMRVYQRFLTRG
jgi:hypothetical protein